MFKFDLLDNEHPVALYRQAEAVLIKPALLIFVFIYFPWFFLLKYEIAGTYVRLLLFWTILVALYTINKYVLWLINCYVVTNKRLVILKYKSSFNKAVLESPIDRILNVSFTAHGVLPVLFGFGDVQVQVAGLTEPMVFKNVSKPAEVKDFLWKTHSQNEKPHKHYVE